VIDLLAVLALWAFSYAVILCAQGVARALIKALRIEDFTLLRGDDPLIVVARALLYGLIVVAALLLAFSVLTELL
jgi:hypothetical protein